MPLQRQEGAGLVLLPVLMEEGLSVGDGRVPGQHAKRGRLASPIHPQQAETLTDRGGGVLSYSAYACIQGDLRWF